MQIEDVKVGMRVEIAHKKDSPYYLEDAVVLSVESDISGQEHIRLRIEGESADIACGFKASDLERA